LSSSVAGTKARRMAVHYGVFELDHLGHGLDDEIESGR